MDYYNPMAARSTTSSGAAPAATSQPPGAATLGQRRLGYIDNDQLGTGQWGTGESFQGAGRQGSLNAIQDSMTRANPEDYAGMDELRSYYRNQLSDLPGQTANKISSFDTQSQRGMKNLMSQYTSSQAGTGRIGSRQFSGAQGDIMSRGVTDYMNGLSNARTNALSQAGQIGSGLSGVQNQDMQERQFQMQQGQNLSNAIMRLMGMDKATPDKNAEAAAASKQQTGQLLQTGAMVGGTLLAGPAGGAAAGMAAKAATPDAGST